MTTPKHSPFDGLWSEAELLDQRWSKADNPGAVYIADGQLVEWFAQVVVLAHENLLTQGEAFDLWDKATESR